METSADNLGGVVESSKDLQAIKFNTNLCIAILGNSPTARIGEWYVSEVGKRPVPFEEQPETQKRKHVLFIAEGSIEQFQGKWFLLKATLLQQSLQWAATHSVQVPTFSTRNKK